MTNLTGLKLEDIPELQEIWAKFYVEDFEFPDFSKGFHVAFVIRKKDDNRIISAGGIRFITEVVLLTNKDISIKIRREALEEILGASVHICREQGHEELTAFIQNPMKKESWVSVLRKYGFRTIRGLGMVLKFR
jgi:hypothetical protein